MSKRLLRIRQLLAVASLLMTSCWHGGSPPTARANEEATADTLWQQWGRLQPLTVVASQRVHDPDTRDVLLQVSTWLAKGEVLRSEQALRKLATSRDRHWIAVARADLAALHFTECLGGVVLRLPTTIGANQRMITAQPPAAILANDVQLEHLLVEVDEAALQDDVALHTQALIARARLVALAQQCPANRVVATRAGEQLAVDLSLLASLGHLTPDLAFLWAIDRLDAASPTSARPFLLKAREGGYADPTVDLLLAQIDLDLGHLDSARKAAVAAKKALSAPPNRSNRLALASACATLGDIEQAQGQSVTALRAYDEALTLAPGHPNAVLGKAQLTLQREGSATATHVIAQAIERGQSAQALQQDVQARLALAATVDGLLAGLDRQPALFDVVHQGLLAAIERDQSSVRRAHRYLAAATLDARLGDTELARGHAALARDCWQQSGLTDELKIAEFMRHLDVLENEQ